MPMNTANSVVLKTLTFSMVVGAIDTHKEIIKLVQKKIVMCYK